MPAITAALFVAMFLLVSHIQGPVHAYLDPGTGSLAIQFLIGTTVALLAAVRLYWERLKTFLRRKQADPEVAPETR